MNHFRTLRIVTAARLLAPLLLTLGVFGPLPLAAQSVNDFDLRPRATPTPAPPPVVGPSDPENPTVRTRPRAEPTAAAPPIVVPPVTPATTTAAPSATTQPRPQPRAATPQSQAASAPGPVAPQIEPGAAGPAPTAAAPPPPAAPYQPRQLDVVSRSSPSLLWALLGGLVVLLGSGGWLVWSRHLRHRARALPAPEIVRPHVPARAAPVATPAPAAANDPAPALGPVLGLTLQATRMSATLVNTTLSYRLAVTNNGAEPLRDVIVAGDMIAAHASRPVEELLGAGGAALPELHRIAGLAPGESVTLGGDIRLPLVSITPIRSGNAALFVPLARLRARGTGASGATIEGGGTFLVGQPGAAGAGRNGARLQPFRLDLGPRNYSRLSQQLLPAA